MDASEGETDFYTAVKEDKLLELIYSVALPYAAMFVMCVGEL